MQGLMMNYPLTLQHALARNSERKCLVWQQSGKTERSLISTTGERSHAFAVGSLVPWAEAGVGAVATQAFANIDYGPEGLALMREGLHAEQALETLLKRDEEREIRQIALIDAHGTVAARYTWQIPRSLFPLRTLSTTRWWDSRPGRRSRA